MADWNEKMLDEELEAIMNDVPEQDDLEKKINQIINRMEALNEVNEKILIDKTAIDMSQIKETILLRNRTVGQTANVQELIVVNDCYLTSVTEKKAVYLDNESLRYLCRQILWGE